MLVVLVLFLLRPGASRLKSRIVLSMSSALGRSVDIGSVHLRLLPRPGFDLENLVVYDDPAFGAEPMLRAGDVTADLRLMSLLRGRLEIARLDLSEPSLNLVHGQNGRWNLEALLERTAHTPLAPTAKAKAEPRPAFPYIEASSARINFKNGTEKKPYALTNADFSLWQDSENAWGVRLQAQPIRTDLNLSDIGVLRVSGTWQRAPTLRETPLQLSLEWRGPQLGQLSKFFTGADQGWRGGVQLDATLNGTPAKLAIASDAVIQDFRRYDITSGQPLTLVAHCDGSYSSLDREFHEVGCTAPVGNGRIVLKGELGLPGSHIYNLALTASDIPAAAAVALAQRAKKNLPLDLSANGTVRGAIKIDGDAASALRVDGKGEIDGFRLASAANQAEIGPETIPFAWKNGASRRSAELKGMPPIVVPAGLHLEFGPFSAGAHAMSPTVRGWITRSAYGVSLTSNAEISHVLRLAHMLGIPALQIAPAGTALLDLQVAGSWGGGGAAAVFSGPQVTGTAKLHNVRLAIRGAGEPVEINSADIQFSPDAVRIGKLSATAAGTSWTGSVEMPRGCGAPGACQIHFNLAANQIRTGALREWSQPRAKEQPWYRVLEPSGSTAPSFLASVRASGHVTAGRLQVRGFTATNVSADVTLDRAKLRIAQLSANFLGGKQRGTWQADFSVKPAACHGTGNLTGVSLAQLAGAAKGPWITGSAAGSYEVKGSCGTDFWQAAEGTLQFDISGGTLPGISLADDEAPLKITRLSGQARMRDGKIETKNALLESASGKFELSGTASLQRQLDFKLTRFPGAAAPGYSITGTLADPRVTPLPGTEQARLKPDAK